MVVLTNSAVNLIYLAIIVVATYVSTFHLILWFENREALSKKIFTKKTPGVSIILPAYNEEHAIENTLQSLLKINYPKNKMEIIVVDDGSTDKTYEKAVKFKSRGVKIFRKSNGGKASALNLGIKKSKNDFVVVTDADSIQDRNALFNAMQHFTDPKVAAVTTHILVRRKKNLLENWQDLEFMIISIARKIREKLDLIEVTPGPMSVYDKKILYKIGLFDEKNLLEDVEIGWRIMRSGYKIKMAYDSIVYSNYPHTLKSWWNQRTRWGVGGLQTLVKHFPCILRSHPLGTFVIPLSLMGYVLQIAGVLASAYIFGNALLSNGLYYMYSILLGTKTRFAFDFLVNEFTLYGIAVLILSVVAVAATLKSYGKRPGIFSLLTFMSIYIFLFSLVGLYSLYKYLRGDFRWFTK